MRGIFDYGYSQIVSINGITDGTSNTICVGNSCPRSGRTWPCTSITGQPAGTTVPINLDSNAIAPGDPGCAQPNYWECCNAAGCRFSGEAEGFKSRHPGGANFLFCDGSVKFLKASISMPTYWPALGSRGGGEVVSMTLTDSSRATRDLVYLEGFDVRGNSHGESPGAAALVRDRRPAGHGALARLGLR